jgi:hypothetical protein
VGNKERAQWLTGPIRAVRGATCYQRTDAWPRATAATRLNCLLPTGVEQDRGVVPADGHGVGQPATVGLARRCW